MSPVALKDLFNGFVVEDEEEVEVPEEREQERDRKQEREVESQREVAQEPATSKTSAIKSVPQKVQLDIIQLLKKGIIV